MFDMGVQLPVCLSQQMDGTSGKKYMCVLGFSSEKNRYGRLFDSNILYMYVGF